ncbi:hypothetical protein [Pedobacter sp. UYP24]
MKGYKILVLMAFTVLFYSCSSDNRKNTAGSDSLDKDTVSTSNAIKTELTQDSLLIPGKSAGLIHIDQDASEVMKIYGKADSGDAAMQKAVAIWYKDHNPKSYSTAIYTVRDTGSNPPARIRQIRVTAPGFKTAEGLGISSSLDKLSKTYAISKVKPGKDTNKEIYDSKTGITFEIDKEKKCTAIIIHESGQALSSTYLPFW